MTAGHDSLKSGPSVSDGCAEASATTERIPSTEATLRKALRRLMHAVAEYTEEHFLNDERGMAKAAKKVDAAMRDGAYLLRAPVRRGMRAVSSHVSEPNETKPSMGESS